MPLPSGNRARSPVMLLQEHQGPPHRMLFAAEARAVAAPCPISLALLCARVCGH